MMGIPILQNGLQIWPILLVMILGYIGMIYIWSEKENGDA